MGTGIIFIAFWLICAVFTKREKVCEFVREEIREGLCDGSIEEEIK